MPQNKRMRLRIIPCDEWMQNLNVPPAFRTISPYWEEPMGKKDARVDRCIASAADFAKPILNHLRQLVHAACPEVEETLKWRFPFFMYKGILFGMPAFKNHCRLVFWHRDIRKAIRNHTDADARQFDHITQLSDLPKDAVLSKYIKEAMKLNEAGVKPRAARKPAKRIKTPAYLISYLKQNKKAYAGFQSLSPSHQNEYVQWITQAKREATRHARMAQMLKWLSEGKSRNWKYEAKSSAK
jgi:uncharacterized protein YdeI (YjbR/CyaY-like superfamily)